MTIEYVLPFLLDNLATNAVVNVLSITIDNKQATK